MTILCILYILAANGYVVPTFLFVLAWMKFVGCAVISTLVELLLKKV